ncbi:substrate-binding domain-containing protein [Aestuariispira insulae]|uniref:Tungstate transport system substrate-binding protein n=1 Tax=Aestuariispira insulae TaxID=1461337 RepID=A0A3D9HWZ4_9PROT|nr:substrate-binding domain-containing protein [Aestuariispira insulae]RED53945.1 tungstate transport system substrate-binding protein [Aestuariispira insulae]
MFCRALTILGGLFLALNAQIAIAAEFITVASTTSTQNSGLFDHILPAFTEKTGIEVRVVAVGTGAAIKLAKNGDADVLFVHHKPSEEQFVAEGYGVERFDVMYNDFIIVGPKADPAGIKGMTDVTAALAQVADQGAAFASRGDDSGTHKKELGLWKEAGVDPTASSGNWYNETGSGMGATLNVAAAKDAYALSDRGTWLSFKNRGTLGIQVAGDTRLFNQYGVILVNPDRHGHVKVAESQAFIDWLRSDEGQALIDGFTINGEKLFNANAQ